MGEMGPSVPGVVGTAAFAGERGGLAGPPSGNDVDGPEPLGHGSRGALRDFDMELHVRPAPGEDEPARRVVVDGGEMLPAEDVAEEKWASPSREQVDGSHHRSNSRSGCS